MFFYFRLEIAGSGSASTERTSEEHSSIEGQAGINMCQIDPFCGSAPTNLSHNMNMKIIKESCNSDATNQPHDATHENVDAGNHSHHIHQIVSIWTIEYQHFVHFDHYTKHICRRLSI